ncbi:polyadenylate binding protein (nucleomorph) [Guillardia theta]|uniref:Polyadenylate binding protein n=1 Tax=Guillardia theta TaxID=55529 RepID=Q98RL2_GUITH|nr:polyadenylate binding protein [Guillardia theta]AAK39936.1 polyadenylate binding protein [Guillardia theta]
MSRIEITNVSLSTDLKTIEQIFSTFGKITEITHKNKKNSKIFIGFKSCNSANFAIKTFDKKFLNGNRVYLKKAIGYNKKYLIKRKISLLENNINKNYTHGFLKICNFSIFTSDEEIKKVISAFGMFRIIEIVEHNSSKFGSKSVIVEFFLKESLVKSHLSLNGKILHGRILKVELLSSRLNNFKSISKNMFLKYSNTLKTQLKNSNRSWISFFYDFRNNISELHNRIFSNSISKILDNNDTKILNAKIVSDSRLQFELFYNLRKKFCFNFIFSKKNDRLKLSKKSFFLKFLSKFNLNFFRFFFSKFGSLSKIVLFQKLNIIYIKFKKKEKAQIAFSKIKSINFFLKYSIIKWATINLPNDIEYLNSLDLKQHLNFSLTNLNINFNYKNQKKITLYNEILASSKYKLLVKNIPFNISSSRLKRIFQNLPMIKSVRIPKNNGFNRGFGFLIFEDLDSIKKSFLYLQNTYICKRKISLSIIM